ncbi:helix-turn-helix transcriptional regulator [Promicromonospora sp. NPDC023805]|uniref:helix-turn-helix domain-containing protein n=1 Tax=Promicromonospora sp. NPDC023805 TaxID=3154696 RepID=UPI00340FA983
MAAKIPAWNQQDLAAATGLDASGLSRALRAKRGLTVYELLKISSALGVAAGRVIDDARRLASGGQPDVVQLVPHATTVTAEDIAAGVALPRSGPRQRRTQPSTDTVVQKHR